MTQKDMHEMEHVFRKVMQDGGCGATKEERDEHAKLLARQGEINLTLFKTLEKVNESLERIADKLNGQNTRLTVIEAKDLPESVSELKRDQKETSKGLLELNVQKATLVALIVFLAAIGWDILKAWLQAKGG